MNSKKIFSKSVTIIVFKDNLRNLNLLMLFFSGTIIPFGGDKRERLLWHHVFALFLKFGVRYLSICFWNSEIVGLLERRH